MRWSARTAFKVLLSAVLGLFSLPMLGCGGYLSLCWFRIHTSDVYYADYPVPRRGWDDLGIDWRIGVLAENVCG